MRHVTDVKSYGTSENCGAGERHCHSVKEKNTFQPQIAQISADKSRINFSEYLRLSAQSAVKNFLPERQWGEHLCKPLGMRLVLPTSGLIRVLAVALFALFFVASLPLAAQQPPASLNESMIRNLVLTWYSGTNEHRPVDELLAMLSDDVEMRYPNRAEPFKGKDSFRAWYADVLVKYFDETHYLESCVIKTDGNSATAAVTVRWERRTWAPGTARSRYEASLSNQRFEFSRDPATGRVVICKKIVDTFEPTAPIFGVAN